MKKLSPKILVKWGILPFIFATAFFSVLISAIYYAGSTGSLTIINQDMIAPVFWLYVISIVSIVAAVVIRYTGYSYEITDKYFLVSKGVIHKHKITIPYINVQDIKKEKDFLDIVCGTCTITVETAGGNVATNFSIPGIDSSSKLEEQILQYKNKELKEEEDEKIDELTEIGKVVIMLSEQIYQMKIELNRFFEEYRKDRDKLDECITGPKVVVRKKGRKK
ncbi:PH domain-containing protein [Candidatus Micrarchaeota archaeon]|nr:PH domain-containing protein [Candidatus Micrarchaeota archaeon]